MILFKKTLAVFTAAILLAVCAVPAFAADTVKVSLRVEGIKDCLFYDSVTVADGATVLDVLQTADAATESLTANVFDGEYGPYVFSINGLEAGTQTEKHWDGWMYHVNDLDPGIGMSACTVTAGDDIVIFYSDEYNIGMLYPTVDLSKIEEGKIFFTSENTVYDEAFNPTVVTAAVTGHTLIWDGKRITPDEDGIATIPVSKLGKGAHKVQIERYDEATGMPTVLRFAPDHTVDTGLSLFARIQLFFTRFFAAVKNLFNR